MCEPVQTQFYFQLPVMKGGLSTMTKNLMLVAMLGIALLISSGCAAVLVGGGAGAGTVTYLKGELKTIEEASLNNTWNAAQKAMEDLEFLVESTKKDALAAKLVALRANNKKITIHLRKVSEELTEVKIRVGIFGDESLSRLILDKLKDNL